MQLPKYPLPSYLRAIFTVSTYAKFLKTKAQNLRNRDRKHKKPVALKFTVAQYREKVHNAIMTGGRTDPYTGEAIDWTLIKDWDPPQDTFAGNRKAGGFNRALFLSPAVDHVDPDSNDLEFEICTWIVNACKSRLNPADFIALCHEIAAYRENAITRATFSMPRKYLPPPYLEGIFTAAQYEHMLDVRAEDIYKRDIVLKRPYALNGSKAFYKEQINKAVWECGGIDPYTGDKLDFTLIGKWDSRKNMVVRRLGAGRLDKAFYLLPVVDHIDPNAPQLAFEICSWLVNECKSDLNPEDFIALCGRVAAHRKVVASRAEKRKKSRPRKKPWSLYILECGDGSLYTGISNNVEKRLTSHQSGKGAKYTRTHQPVRLMYVEKCGAQGKAMSREREVKRYPKKKKLALFSE